MVYDPNSFVTFKPKDSPYWYYYVYRDGKKVWRSTGQKVKTKAIGVIFERIANGDILEDMPFAREITFGEFAKNFWDYDTCPHIREKIKRGSHFTRKEAERYQTRLNKYIMPTFKYINILNMSHRLINDWFLDLPDKYEICYKTCNDILSELKIILDFAVYQEIIPTNNARTVKQFAKRNSKVRGCFTETQVRDIFSYPWSNILAYTACRLSECTGLRMGEVQALKLGNIQERKGLDGSVVYYLHITSSYSPKEGIKSTKNGKARDIKIHPILRKMLVSLPTVQDTLDPNALLFTIDKINPMDRRVVLDRLQHVMSEVGIDYKTENLSFHSFRHFANSHYIPVLGGERTRMMIGHESEAMTKNYLHDTDEDYKQITELQEKLLSI